MLYLCQFASLHLQDEEKWFVFCRPHQQSARMLTTETNRDAIKNISSTWIRNMMSRFTKILPYMKNLQNVRNFY